MLSPKKWSYKTLMASLLFYILRCLGLTLYNSWPQFQSFPPPNFLNFLLKKNYILKSYLDPRNILCFLPFSMNRCKEYILNIQISLKCYLYFSFLSQQDGSGIEALIDWWPEFEPATLHSRKKTAPSSCPRLPHVHHGTCVILTNI